MPSRGVTDAEDTPPSSSRGEVEGEGEGGVFCWLPSTAVTISLMAGTTYTTAPSGQPPSLLCGHPTSTTLVCTNMPAARWANSTTSLRPNRCVRGEAKPKLSMRPAGVTLRLWVRPAGAVASKQEAGDTLEEKAGR